MGDIEKKLCEYRDKINGILSSDDTDGIRDRLNAVFYDMFQTIPGSRLCWDRDLFIISGCDSGEARRRVLKSPNLYMCRLVEDPDIEEYPGLTIGFKI